MPKKLGKIANKEIRDSIRRCTNSRQISAEADRLAGLHQISKSRIYEITKDIRPKRKRRSDKGKRTADLLNHEGLKVAASYVVEYNIDPAEAIRTAKERGYEIPVELPTFTRYLREAGLNRKNRIMGRTNFRRFEAKAPGEVYQFDISGSKERWFDTKTRRIIQVSVLDVSKNHPNENKDRTRVWRFVLLDDHSRRRFIRFVACDKPNSSHVIEFLMEAYEELGVPKILYTDNDAVIKFGRNKRASKILNKALENLGGYELQHHLPGNSRATGKVENAHKWVEKMEKMLGLFIKEGRELTMEVLNRFARQMEKEYNHRVHRETNETPMARWMSQIHTVRTVDAKILRSAFLADEFQIIISGALTFRHKGNVYQLPQEDVIINLIARQSKAEKCKIIFPDEADFYTLIDFDGNEYDIQKVIATPDTIGEFKSTADDVAATTKKELKKFAKAQAKAERERNKKGLQQPKPIAVLDTEFEAPQTNVVQMPKPKNDVTKRVLESVVEPNQNVEIVAARTEKYAGHLLTYWEAVKKYSDEFNSKSDCKTFLDGIYPTRQDEQPESIIKDALEEYQTEHRKLRLAN